MQNSFDSVGIEVRKAILLACSWLKLLCSGPARFFIDQTGEGGLSYREKVVG